MELEAAGDEGFADLVKDLTARIGEYDALAVPEHRAEQGEVAAMSMSTRSEAPRTRFDEPDAPERRAE